VQVAGPAIRVIKRNCSASPRQLAGVFESVVAVSTAFGVACAAQGLWMVFRFVGLEALAVATAFTVAAGMRWIAGGSDFRAVRSRWI